MVLEAEVADAAVVVLTVVAVVVLTTEVASSVHKGIITVVMGMNAGVQAAGVIISRGRTWEWGGHEGALPPEGVNGAAKAI